MIASLSGTILSKQDRTIVLDVNGIGYLVHIPRPLEVAIETGQKLFLFIHTNVREDDISLFGFSTEEEWKFFKLLLTVSGVGPKSALEILGVPLGKIRSAIAKKDVLPLTAISGIGKKTAERIIVDLHGKMKEDLLEEDIEERATPVTEDIIQALVSLGYRRHQVLEGLKKIPAEISQEEAIIKYFLQNI